MTIKEFIEKAIEGGWERVFSSKPLRILESKEDVRDVLVFWSETELPQKIRIHEALLDPKAWEAVGRVEGWPEWRCECGLYYDKQGMIQCPKCNKTGAHYSWVRNMHNMIDALTEGQSLEEYLETL